MHRFIDKPAKFHVEPSIPSVYKSMAWKFSLFPLTNSVAVVQKSEMWPSCIWARNNWHSHWWKRTNLRYLALKFLWVAIYKHCGIFIHKNPFQVLAKWEKIGKEGLFVSNKHICLLVYIHLCRNFQSLKSPGCLKMSEVSLKSRLACILKVRL